MICGRSRDIMKKLIIVTGAFLVLVQSVYAQVNLDASLHGSAEAGYVFKDERIDTTNPFSYYNNSGLLYDLNIQGAVVGNTSTRLSFGAVFDLYNVFAPNDEETELDLQVYLSGTFGTLVYGDTEGAYDRVLREVDIGDTIGDAPDLA